MSRCPHCGATMERYAGCLGCGYIPEREAHSLQRPCSVTPAALIVAFVQGAQWWEYHKTGATMWPSDRDQAEGEAEIRAANGTLGKSPNDPDQRPGESSKTL